MHRRRRAGIRQLADTDTGKYSPILSESEKDILWREEQDAKVYEDRANGWYPKGGKTSKYLSNLHDIDEIVEEEYIDQYSGLSSKFIKGQIEKKGWDLGNFKSEEIDLAGRYPLKTLTGYENMKTALNMEAYIADKHYLSNDDNTKVNAWKHAYLAALHKDAFGKDIATKFVNAHENSASNVETYRDYAIMDLHNNAIGLSIDKPKDMSDEDFAEYVFQIIDKDGYWIKPEGEEHIPRWALNADKDD